jgi:hypothetical protein
VNGDKKKRFCIQECGINYKQYILTVFRDAHNYFLRGTEFHSVSFQTFI